MPLVLLAIAAVLAVAVARLAIWLKHERSRVLTVGMLAIGLGFLAAQPIGDHTIDTWVPNLSELLHALLIVLAGWAYGVTGLRALDLAPRARLWTGLAVATAGGMLVLWAVGGLSRTPTDTVAEIHDPTVAPLTIVYCWWVATACGLVVASAIDALRRGGTGIRWLLIGMLAGGAMGLGYVVTKVTLLLVAPEVARENAHAIQSAWAGPGLIFLAVAGLPGFLATRLRK